MGAFFLPKVSNLCNVSVLIAHFLDAFQVDFLPENNYFKI